MIPKYFFIFFIALTGLFAACKKKQTVNEEPKNFTLSDTMAKMVAIDSVRNCNVSNELTLSGQVSFDENKVVKIFPRSSGQVIESKVTFGDRVTTGQVLAVIRSADVAGSYSDLRTTGADVAIAKRQMDNTESLYKSGISSEREYTEAKQNYEKALAARQKIQATLNINGGSKTSAGGTYVLTSPINGYIVEKKVNAGSFIRQDMSDNLFTISDLKDVWVMANVFEADIHSVKEGFPVKVTTLSYPDKVFEGKIDKISEVLDPTNKALKVRVRLDNSQLLLKPEMFAKVIVLNTEARKSLCIPTKALIAQNGKNYVVVYNNNSDMKIAEVDIVQTVGDQTYINSGLAEGQKIITQNQLLVFQQLLND